MIHTTFQVYSTFILQFFPYFLSGTNTISIMILVRILLCVATLDLQSIKQTVVSKLVFAYRELHSVSLPGHVLITLSGRTSIP